MQPRSRRLLSLAGFLLLLAVCWAGFGVHQAGAFRGGSKPAQGQQPAKLNYYQALGLTKSADAATIKKVYRQQSLKFHPDKSPDPEAGRRFAEVAEAYEVLGNTKKRRIYDTQGHAGLERLQQREDQGQHGQQVDPFQMFGNMFGFQQQQQQQRQGGRGQHAEGEETLTPTPRDLVLELPVSLRDLYLGMNFPVSVRQQQLCPHCRGSGAEDDEQHLHTCGHCGGQGFTIVRQPVGPGFVQQVQQQCPKCQGQGRIITQTCHVCSGQKVVTGSNILDVLVEPGAKDNSYVVFEQAADEPTDGSEPASVFFQLRQQPHPIFSRDGDNLRTRIEISLVEALTGFSRTLKHLDDRPVRIARGLPGEDGEGQVTSHGDVLTVAEEGMPKSSHSSERGDLFVEFSVRFPTSLSPEQKRVIEAL